MTPLRTMRAYYLACGAVTALGALGFALAYPSAVALFTGGQLACVGPLAALVGLIADLEAGGAA